MVQYSICSYNQYSETIENVLRGIVICVFHTITHIPMSIQYTGMTFEVLGSVLGLVIYTLYFVGFVGISEEEECEGEVREPATNQRRAYFYHSITVGVILIACVVTTYLGVKEQEGD